MIKWNNDCKVGYPESSVLDLLLLSILLLLIQLVTIKVFYSNILLKSFNDIHLSFHLLYELSVAQEIPVKVLARLLV